MGAARSLSLSDNVPVMAHAAPSASSLARSGTRSQIVLEHHPARQGSRRRGTRKDRKRCTRPSALAPDAGEGMLSLTEIYFNMKLQYIVRKRRRLPDRRATAEAGVPPFLRERHGRWEGSRRGAENRAKHKPTADRRGPDTSSGPKQFLSSRPGRADLRPGRRIEHTHPSPTLFINTTHGWVR